MPITPLHLGILAPLNHFFPKKVSNIGFILMTLTADANAILYYAFGLSTEPFHGPMVHSFMGALLVGTGLAMLRFWSLPWILGVYLGGFTHVLLDMLVHVEMMPLYPFYQGNPFYGGHMDLLSLILCVPFAWLIGQYVTAALGWGRKRLVARPLQR